MGAPADKEEAQHLMAEEGVAAVTVEEAVKVQPERSWRSPLWRVCGDFSPEDVAAGCISWHVPAVAFGWNMKRALQRRFLREVFRVVLVLCGTCFGLKVAAHALLASCAPEDGDDADDIGNTGDVDTVTKGLKSQTDTQGPDGVGRGSRTWGDEDGHHHHHHIRLDEMPAECRGRVLGGFAVLIVIAIAVFVFAVVYAARRRRQMREQFGIAGTFRGDVLAWAFCGPCALAQETRTLMGAQVHDGVWYGPVPGAAAAHTSVPAEQCMA